MLHVYDTVCGVGWIGLCAPVMVIARRSAIVRRCLMMLIRESVRACQGGPTHVDAAHRGDRRFVRRVDTVLTTMFRMQSSHSERAKRWAHTTSTARNHRAQHGTATYGVVWHIAIQ